MLAMPEAEPRWEADELVDDVLVAGLASQDRAPLPTRRGQPRGASVGGSLRHDPRCASHHRDVADGIYAACGFSGHGFMQSPAVGRIVADELIDGGADFDLAPYRLERFADGGNLSPETAIL